MNKTLDVLCIGIQVIDMIVSRVDTGIVKKEVTHVDSIKMTLGGDALNQAIVLSKLGAQTGLMGVVGNDALGSVLVHQIQQHPIRLFEKTLDSQTSISLVLIDEDGERHFVLQMGQNKYFCYDHIDEAALEQAKIVSFASCMFYDKFDGESLIRLLEKSRSCGALSVIDFKAGYESQDYRRVKESLRHADYIMPSEAEAALLLGRRDTPKQMAHGLRDMGAKNVVVKLGDQGCYVCAEEVDQQFAACPCKCIDTTGAGDTFVAAFLYAKARGWSLDECARFANAAGSIAVEYPGANDAIQSLEQVRRRMAVQ